MFRKFLALVVGLSLVGCAGLLSSSSDPSNLAFVSQIPKQMELVQVPFYPQQAYQCGPSALATVLQNAGITRSPEDLQSQVYLPARQGSLQVEMLGAARKAGALPYVLEPTLEALMREVAAGHPVVVLQNLRFSWLPQWHYAVVVGYDFSEGVVILRSGTTQRQVTSIAEFERSWAKSYRWAFVALPPDQLPATAHEVDFVVAAIDLERVSAPAGKQAFQTALATWPQNLMARLALGNAYYRAHELQAARYEYQQATVDHPEAADAWNNLAQVLYESKELPAAQQAASKAVAMGGPHLAIYQSTLSNIQASFKPRP